MKMCVEDMDTSAAVRWLERELRKFKSNNPKEELNFEVNGKRKRKTEDYANKTKKIIRKKKLQ